MQIDPKMNDIHSLAEALKAFEKFRAVTYIWYGEIKEIKLKGSVDQLDARLLIGKAEVFLNSAEHYAKSFATSRSGLL